MNDYIYRVYLRRYLSCLPAKKYEPEHIRLFIVKKFNCRKKLKLNCGSNRHQEDFWKSFFVNFFPPWTSCCCYCYYYYYCGVAESYNFNKWNGVRCTHSRQSLPSPSPVAIFNCIHAVVLIFR